MGFKLYRPQKDREKKKLAKRLWAPSEASNEDKPQAGHKKKETVPWQWEIHRGASTEARRCTDEGRSQMITYINLTSNANFQSNNTR